MAIYSRVGAGGVREITTLEVQDAFSANGSGTFQQRIVNLSKWPVGGKAGTGVSVLDVQAQVDSTIPAGTSDP